MSAPEPDMGYNTVSRTDAVIRVIEDNRRALDDLCRRFRVRSLELFGSAAHEGFDPESGDLDLHQVLGLLEVA